MSEEWNDLARRLRMLPTEAPSPALWERLDSAYRAEFVRRPRRRMVPLALAACALFAAPALWLLTRPSEVSVDVVTLRIEAIDRALQRAYLEGASDAELEALWRRREALIEARPQRNEPVRI